MIFSMLQNDGVVIFYINTMGKLAETYQFS
ncbi:hypothetical protein SRABI04_02758 [Chryseobacterium sp. Bi04]|nr:hypothetical protein SRABI04_02758 [Chryseobacterium sp. Bi04]